MPVRIYDISKKLGLENKEVLSKAKELGIVARVASSSLDKITAEYLEQQLILAHPHLAAPTPVASSSAPSSKANEPIVVVKAPQAQSERVQETGTATALLEPEAPTADLISPLAETKAPENDEIVSE